MFATTGTVVGFVAPNDAISPVAACSQSYTCPDHSPRYMLLPPPVLFVPNVIAVTGAPSQTT